MTILGLAESFKMVNQPEPTVTLFDSLFLRKFIRYGQEILTQTFFKSPIRAMKIWDQYL